MRRGLPPAHRSWALLAAEQQELLLPVHGVLTRSGTGHWVVCGGGAWLEQQQLLQVAGPNMQDQVQAGV